jgi:hypothetical protein
MMGDLLRSLVWRSQKRTILYIIGVGCYKLGSSKITAAAGERETEERERKREHEEVGKKNDGSEKKKMIFLFGILMM